VSFVGRRNDKEKDKDKKSSRRGGDSEGSGPLELDMEDLDRRMKSALTALRNDFANMKVGRAAPMLLDKISVTLPDDQVVPLLQLATVAVQDPQNLMVNVFAQEHVPAVREAIAKSPLNLNPQVETSGIKVPIPKSTQEHRQNLLKQAQKRAEEAKLSSRLARQEAMKDLKKVEKTQSKDYIKRTEKQVQDATDRHVRDVDQAFGQKEREINSF